MLRTFTCLVSSAGAGSTCVAIVEEGVLALGALRAAVAGRELFGTFTLVLLAFFLPAPALGLAPARFL